MKLLLIAMLLLAGCNSAEDVKRLTAQGELRHKLFVECMELSAKMPRKSDDDVHKVVDACSSQSYYMANQMTPVLGGAK
jgi:uncharacterized protein YcfL